MNLLIVGNDQQYVENLALDIWRGNTNYEIINLSPCLWSSAFKGFIKNKDVIVCTTPNQLESREINDVLSKLLELNFIPVFVAEDENDIVQNMYTMLKDEIYATILYLKNEKNENYDEFVKICQDYLLDKGIIDEYDTVVQTSTGGEETSTGE